MIYGTKNSAKECRVIHNYREKHRKQNTSLMGKYILFGYSLQVEEINAMVKKYVLATIKGERGKKKCTHTAVVAESASTGN